MKESYLNQKYPKLASKSTCTACMACIDSCAHKALTYEIDKFGYFEIIADIQKCVNCELCSKHCPVLNPPINAVKYLECFSAWSNKDEQRRKSASGGAFAAIAYEIIKRGGIVYGATIEGLNIRHKRIDKIENLHLLQGSKYQPSILVDIYKSVKADLKSGRLVLFSGLGCQVYGLLSFLENTVYENLFTIDNICGGVATMSPMMNLSKENKYSSIVSFRDKENGWKSHKFEYQLKMLSINGQVENLSSQNM